MARNRESAAIVESPLRGHQGRQLDRQTTAAPTTRECVVEEVGNVHFEVAVPVVAKLKVSSVVCQQRREQWTAR